MALNEKYRQLWKLAGYERGHGSDAVLKPAPTGYERLYYLTGSDHALSNVAFGRLKIARFSELNDPFELLGQYIGDENTRKLVRNNKNVLNDSKGVICFSEDWVDPVLWSHYANNHRGVALGFDVSSPSVKQVEYSEKRLKYKIPKTATKITAELAELLIYTKYESWSYEREWRYLVDLKKAYKDGELYFLPFGNELRLVEVILGSLCSMDLKKFREIVNRNYKNVMTYKARLAYRSFRIIPNGKSVIQP